MANYDAFYRRMCDLAVMIGQAERHAESMGFNNSAIKLQDMRASVNKIASNVMTKIEAEHISRMERRKDLTKKILHRGGLPSPGETPRVIQQGRSMEIDPNLSPSQMMNALTASGLQVIVIDENTDFSKLPIPGQPDPRTDGSVESPHADEPIELAPPNDPPPAPSE